VPVFYSIAVLDLKVIKWTSTDASPTPKLDHVFESVRIAALASSMGAIMQPQAQTRIGRTGA
jgi:hypothetical protein